MNIEILKCSTLELTASQQLVYIRIIRLSCYITDSDAVDVGQSLKFCISNKLPCIAVAVGS